MAYEGGGRLFGSRDGFGLEFHVERDPGLLCVDVFVGGVHVNAWDNAFYPPLLVKKLGDELPRFRGAGAAPVGFSSPVEAFLVAESWAYDEVGEEPEVGEALARWAFLDWGECTNDVRAFAFPDGEWLHLGCRLYEEGRPALGAPTVASVSRVSFVETLEQGLDVAEREWAVRLAAIMARYEEARE
ncbi:hypothetical protein ABZX85_21835 [Streptomyces sp. NPDC004539]|uniref:hypothetical protein n=1 Tax=Streptomyces sp. NPDC004539 TaxID=3154280 RepID=UPI0033BE8B33